MDIPFKQFSQNSKILFLKIVFRFLVALFVRIPALPIWPVFVLVNRKADVVKLRIPDIKRKAKKQNRSREMY